MRQFKSILGRKRFHGSDTSSEGTLQVDLKDCTCHHCGYYMTEPILYMGHYYEKEHLQKGKPRILPKGTYFEDLGLEVDIIAKKNCRKARRIINDFQLVNDEASSVVNSHNDPSTFTQNQRTFNEATQQMKSYISNPGTLRDPTYKYDDLPIMEEFSERQSSRSFNKARPSYMQPEQRNSNQYKPITPLISRKMTVNSSTQNTNNSGKVGSMQDNSNNLDRIDNQIHKINTIYKMNQNMVDNQQNATKQSIASLDHQNDNTGGIINGGRALSTNIKNLLQTRHVSIFNATTLNQGRMDYGYHADDTFNTRKKSCCRRCCSSFCPIMLTLILGLGIGFIATFIMMMHYTEEQGDLREQQGKQLGFQQGYKEGNQTGFESGVEHSSLGYEMGLKHGYDSGYKDGNSSGYKMGFHNGSLQAREELQEEYKEQLEQAMEESYTEGMKQGKHEQIVEWSDPENLPNVTYFLPPEKPTEDTFNATAVDDTNVEISQNQGGVYTLVDKIMEQSYTGPDEIELKRQAYEFRQLHEFNLVIDKWQDKADIARYKNVGRQSYRDDIISTLKQMLEVNEEFMYMM